MGKSAKLRKQRKEYRKSIEIRKPTFDEFKDFGLTYKHTAEYTSSLNFLQDIYDKVKDGQLLLLPHHLCSGEGYNLHAFIDRLSEDLNLFIGCVGYHHYGIIFISSSESKLPLVTFDLENFCLRIANLIDSDEMPDGFVLGVKNPKVEGLYIEVFNALLPNNVIDPIIGKILVTLTSERGLWRKEFYPERRF